MLVKTALLIVTNPKQIGKILPSVQKNVKNILYIQLLSALNSEPFGNFYSNVFTSWPKYSQTIYGIYAQAATHCKGLDVRVLLSGLKNKQLQSIQTSNKIELVIFDKKFNETEINSFIKCKIGNIQSKCNVLTFDSDAFEPSPFLEEKETPLGNHTVLGGTFDRLHTAHKLLLSEAALIAKKKITVGVTEESMLKNKILWELNEDLETRVQHVESFLKDICSELEINVVTISDPFGPAITDPTMDVIVVSEETIRGGDKINEIREKNGLRKLEMVSIKLLEEPHRNPIEEEKVSSSTTRIRQLGRLIKPVELNDKIPKKPYVIGLTGGVASGKSGVAKWLSFHGVDVINCDLIGHQVYKKGKPCYYEIVKHFGNDVIGEDGEINRATLGAIVFKSTDQLQKLNSLVWPAILAEVRELIAKSTKDVVVIEAAVLLTASWNQICHEIWATLVPQEEAVRRLQIRNNLSAEQALSRINSQPSNTFYVKHANVVFCTMWDVEYTKAQVDRAWDLLQDRINPQS